MARLRACACDERGGRRRRRGVPRGLIASGRVAARAACGRLGAAGEAPEQAQIAEIQRARLLAAAARAARRARLRAHHRRATSPTGRACRGARSTSSSPIARSACVAVLEDADRAPARDELAARPAGGSAWRERMRVGLWTILCFLDREPVLARVCVVQSLRGGPALLALREQLLAPAGLRR